MAAEPPFPRPLRSATESLNRVSDWRAFALACVLSQRRDVVVPVDLLLSLYSTHTAYATQSARQHLVDLLRQPDAGPVDAYMRRLEEAAKDLRRRAAIDAGALRALRRANGKTLPKVERAASYLDGWMRPFATTGVFDDCRVCGVKRLAFYDVGRDLHPFPAPRNAKEAGVVYLCAAKPKTLNIERVAAFRERLAQRSAPAVPA